MICASVILCTGLIGDVRILAPVLDEHEPAAGAQRGADAGHHAGRVGELVIDVDEQREVAALRGELGGVRGGADCLDVGEAG